MTDKKWLRDSKDHLADCHDRWSSRLNRDMDAQGYQDAWYAEQCGGCRFYIRLSGLFYEDWGVCSNARSALDGSVRFEHDGCEKFVPSGTDFWE